MVNTAYQWTKHKVGAIDVTGLAFAALLAHHARLSAVSHNELAPKDTLATFLPVKTARANNVVVEVHTVKIASFLARLALRCELETKCQLPCCSSPQVTSVSRHRRWIASRRSLEHRVHGYCKRPAPTARTATYKTLTRLFVSVRCQL